MPHRLYYVLLLHLILERVDPVRCPGTEKHDVPYLLYLCTTVLYNLDAYALLCVFPERRDIRNL